MSAEAIGRLLLFVGVVAIMLGGLFIILGKLPWLGRLPGDIVIVRENFNLYFPITTSILASLILTVLFNIFWRR